MPFKTSLMKNDPQGDIKIGAEIEEEVRLYLKRLASQGIGEKKILVQMSGGLVGLPLMVAAWSSGLTVAVIREDATFSQLSGLREKLGGHIHFVLRKGPLESFVDTGGFREVLGEWFLGDKGEGGAVEPYQWSEDECALILFTSGSTGRPKGVCHSIGNLLRSARLFAGHFDFKEDDHLLSLAPPHSMSGLRSTVLPLVTRARVTTISDKDASFFSIIESIKSLRPTLVLCGPIFIKQLAAYGKRISEALVGVGALLCTGADLSETDRDVVENELSIPILNYYGLTETSGIVLAETIEDRRPHLLPPPCDRVGVRLADGGEARKGKHLIIESPNLFLGYLGEDLSRKSSFDTGDIVREEPGGLRLLGNASGAVKAPSTEWIFPDLLERWLRAREDLRDAVVKPGKVAGGYGLEVWFDGASGLDLTVITDSIEEEFGPDHRPIKWHNASIRRGTLGSVEEVSEHSAGCDA